MYGLGGNRRLDAVESAGGELRERQFHATANALKRRPRPRQRGGRRFNALAVFAHRDTQRDSQQAPLRRHSRFGIIRTCCNDYNIEKKIKQ